MVSPAIIEYLYPHLTPMVDYEFRDDGAGVALHLWPENEPLPDEAAVHAAEAHLAAAELRDMCRRNNDAYSAATVAITADYPQLEKDTWPTQDQEAAAWLASPDALTPWVDRAAVERGIDREEYLRRTIVKSRQFKALSSFLTGRRQKYEDQIKTGGDPALDYALTPELLAELQQIAVTGMTATIESLRGQAA